MMLTQQQRYLEPLETVFTPYFFYTYVNTSTCFSKDAENLTTYGYVL